MTKSFKRLLVEGPGGLAEGPGKVEVPRKVWIWKKKWLKKLWKKWKNWFHLTCKVGVKTSNFYLEKNTLASKDVKKTQVDSWSTKPGDVDHPIWKKWDLWVEKGIFVGRYCWWKQSCTSQCLEDLILNRVYTSQVVIAGFLSINLGCDLVQDYEDHRENAGDVGMLP